jgi:hypothetical protein
MSEHKEEILKLCEELMTNLSKVKTDGYGYTMITNNLDFLGNIEIKNKLDEVVQSGINKCIELYKTTNAEYNMVDTDGWVNVVRAKDPVQLNFKEGMEKYHVHTEINKQMNSFVPTYTYVYYVQMPNNLEGDDAVLFFKDKDGIEFSILPEEDDLIIMPADIPHSPNMADNSTKDRIVFAGNVGFSYIKKQKSLI